MNNRLLLSLCVLSALFDAAAAQPRGKENEFFEHDYARGIQQAGKPDVAKQKVGQSIRESTANNVTSVANTQAKSAGTPPQISGEAKPDAKPQLSDIPRVELYVNSADTNHLNLAVSRAVELHKKRKIFLIGISHIGDYRTLSPDMSAELTRLAIRYTAAPSVLYGEHIKQSPTWAFVSPEGARLVEGCIDPERYINTNGAEPPTTKLDAMNKEEGSLAGL
jgi:hypothetical protein